MFAEYLINIAITAGAYLPIVVFIVLIGLMLRPIAQMIAELNDDPDLENKIVKHRGKVFKLAAVVAVLVVLFAAVQPSNTYKHVGYNRQLEDQRIKRSLEQQHDRTLPVQDRILQPQHTLEQRKDRFEEMVDRSRFVKQPDEE